MKTATLRMLEALEKDAQPEPPPKQPPDFTGWTQREIADWHIAQLHHADLGKLAREAARSAPERTHPTPREQYDAEDARDEAILAERAAKAAAERAASDPSEATETAAREARETADRANRAAEAAERIAEEAERRLAAPKPEPAPSAEAKAPTETPAPAEAKPKRLRKRREPKPKKQWWEERAQWRMRGPQDEDERRGRPLYRCLVDYDPLEWDNGDEDE
jgi:hypothetical protein